MLRKKASHMHMESSFSLSSNQALIPPCKTRPSPRLQTLSEKEMLCAELAQTVLSTCHRCFDRLWEQSSCTFIFISMEWTLIGLGPPVSILPRFRDLSHATSSGRVTWLGPTLLPVSQMEQVSQHGCDIPTGMGKDRDLAQVGPIRMTLRTRAGDSKRKQSLLLYVMWTGEK